MASKEFLEEMWSQAKKKLPGWLYATLLRNARPAAGGRSSHRIEAPNNLEKIALMQIASRHLKELSDDELDGIWEKLEQWFTNAAKWKNENKHLLPAGLHVRNELINREKEILASAWLDTVCEFDKKSITKQLSLNIKDAGGNIRPEGDNGTWAIQSLIFSKEKFSVEQARDWLAEHEDFANHGVDETESSFRFRQFDPKYFSEYHNVSLSPGITAAYGKIHKTEKALDEITIDSPIPIIKAAPLKRIVYGVVLDPYGDDGAEPDAHNDWNPPSEIEQTAHNYLKNSRVIGLQHQGKADAQVVESWVEQYPTREDYVAAMESKPHSVYRRQFGTDKIHSGAWVLGVELGPEEWQQYLDGKLNAFSPGGYGIRKPIDRTSFPVVSFIELEEKR